MVNMSAIRYNIGGSDYVGAFSTSTDKYIFVGVGLPNNNLDLLKDELKGQIISFSIMGSDLIGLFSKANKNGILLPATTLDYEINKLKDMKLGINIGLIDTDLNAIGNNILVNDKIALINPDYGIKDIKLIEDVFDVEVIKTTIGNFKTLGANNLMTNKGMVINNDINDEDKESIDSITGFDSVRSTANFGSLGVGISVIANSYGIVSGEKTTGYELERLRQGLEIDD